MHSTQTRIVAAHEDGVFVAYCVDHDIVAHANTLQLAISRLRMTVEAERVHAVTHGREPFEGIGKPPAYVEDMFTAATFDATTNTGDATSFKLAA